MTDHFEVAIIGAGPGGLSAAATAASNNIAHILFEKGQVGNTIYDYQLRKHVMAEPARLPLRAKLDFEAGSREKILDAWNGLVNKLKVNVQHKEVTKVSRHDQGYEITAGGLTVTAKHVILAIGMQGTPRRLGVPGDNLAHVAYTLADPDAFTGKNILVVGAGDAAIENALALCEKNSVSVLNRTNEFARAKDANNALIMDAIASGKIRCFYDSELTKVEADSVLINTPNGEVKLACVHIIARIGCIMPRKFLESCGIEFPNADPTSPPKVNRRYECNLQNFFIIGALVGYPLIKQAINQGYEVVEAIAGRPLDPADQVIIEAVLKELPGPVNEKIDMLRRTLSLFSDLTDPQFRELISESKLHVLEPGQVVFERNDYTDTFFSVVSGHVLVDIPTGPAVQIGPSQFFGEMGLISGRRRSARVTAAEPTVLVESPRRQVLKLMSSVESVKAKIDQAFVARAFETSVFPGVDRQFLESLASKAKSKRFKKAEVLFKEGDIGDSLYVIRKGSVKVSRRGTNGKDIVQNYIAAGNYVGEMALLTSEPLARNATVSAAVGCDTIVIDKSDFQDLLQRYPEVGQRITKQAQSRKIENITSTPDVQQGVLLDFLMAQGLTDADNVLLIDSDLCVACDNCEKACAATHNGFSRLDRKGGKSFASIQVPISCRHCENPLCMIDCPPDALTRMPDGEVIIKDSCIGCGNCVKNCPYGVIQLVYDSPESGFSLLSMLGLKKKGPKGPAKAAKCDMCSQLPSGPACVRSCPTGAAIRVNPSQMLEIVSKKSAGAR
jgi:CRP-like cAMP-binding protein/thioredoxin reductase/Fe-S-cluster-containing hydrogenase component 2